MILLEKENTMNNIYINILVSVYSKRCGTVQNFLLLLFLYVLQWFLLWVLLQPILLLLQLQVSI